MGAKELLKALGFLIVFASYWQLPSSFRLVQTNIHSSSRAWVCCACPNDPNCDSCTVQLCLADFRSSSACPWWHYLLLKAHNGSYILQIRVTHLHIYILSLPLLERPRTTHDLWCTKVYSHRDDSMQGIRCLNLVIYQERSSMGDRLCLVLFLSDW